MNTDDPAKLSAALEQLEAEKQRRTDEKVERGEAVRVPRDFTGELVIGLPRPKSEIEALIRKSERDQIARLREAGGRREIYFSSGAIVIITGVPRWGREGCDEPPWRPSGKSYIPPAPGCRDALASVRTKNAGRG